MSDFAFEPTRRPEDLADLSGSGTPSAPAGQESRPAQTKAPYLSLDLRRITDFWPNREADKRVARLITGRCGEDQVQLLCDLGLMQFAVSGRPDGATYHSFDSVLDYCTHELSLVPRSRAAAAIGRLVSGEVLTDLVREANLFNYRRLAFHLMGDFEREARDLAVLARINPLLRQARVADVDFPQHIQQNVIGQVSLALKNKRYEAALVLIRRGVHDIRRFYRACAENNEIAYQPGETPDEIQVLRRLQGAVYERLPVDDPTRLRRGLKAELKAAVEEEDYERAAKLRDALANTRPTGRRERQKADLAAYRQDQENARQSGAYHAKSDEGPRDLRSFLENWVYEPGRISVRAILASDVPELIQTRVDGGLLQMFPFGRPDGLCPYGAESLFEYQRQNLWAHEQAYGSGKGFSLSDEECRALRHEAYLYYQRYLSAFVLERWSEVERDTLRNLRLMDFVKEYAATPESRLAQEHQRPYLMMMNARARAYRMLEAKEYQDALHQVEISVAALEHLSSETGQGVDNETQILEELTDEIILRMPLEAPTRIEYDLRQALLVEDYERAAELRDYRNRVPGPAAAGSGFSEGLW
jgi:hypothetical protein